MIQSLFKFKDKSEDVNKLAFLYLELSDKGLPECDIRKVLLEESDKQSIYRTEQSSRRIVDAAVKFAKGGMRLEPPPISFSYEELEYIHSFNNYIVEKELFIMFCLYKCYGKKPFGFAKRTFCKDCKIDISEYNIKEIITTQESDNLFYKKIQGEKDGGILASNYIKSLYNENNVAFVVDKYDDVIYYYERYINPDKYLLCEKCGQIIKKNNSNIKYCRECSNIIKNHTKESKVRYVVCKECKSVFSTSWKSKRELCDDCFKKDLNLRKGKNRK